MNIYDGLILTLRNLDIPQRLLIIHNELAEVIDRHKPTTAAIEAIFAYKSAESAIRLGQARGIACIRATSQLRPKSKRHRNRRHLPPPVHNPHAPQRNDGPQNGESAQ